MSSKRFGCSARAGIHLSLEAVKNDQTMMAEMLQYWSGAEVDGFDVAASVAVLQRRRLAEFWAAARHQEKSGITHSGNLTSAMRDSHSCAEGMSIPSDTTSAELSIRQVYLMINNIYFWHKVFNLH